MARLATRDDLEKIESRLTLEVCAAVVAGVALVKALDYLLGRFGSSIRTGVSTGIGRPASYQRSNRTSSRSIMSMRGRPDAAMFLASSVCRISTTVCTPSAP